MIRLSVCRAWHEAVLAYPGICLEWFKSLGLDMNSSFPNTEETKKNCTCWSLTYDVHHYEVIVSGQTGDHPAESELWQS